MSKFKDFFTRSSPRAPANSGMVVGRLYGNTIIPTGILSASNAMTNSDIYAITSLVASDIAGMEFHSTPLIETALNRPSKNINPFNFWQSVVAQMLLYGNAYVLINKQQDTITGFELVQDDQVSSIIVSDDGQDLTYLVHFNDKRPDAYYDANEILHFKLITAGSDTSSQYFGKSPLISLVPELSIQGLSNELTKSTLKNGINPAVLIKIPEAKLDRDVKTGIRDSFIDQSTGDNFGKPIVLDSSSELSQLGVSPEVTQLLNNLDFTKTQISKAFGVPDSYLMGQGDQQSSIEMIQGLYQNSITRYKNAIQYELSLKLGVPIEMATELTDDQLIARYTLLAENSIISPVDANQALKQKGII